MNRISWVLLAVTILLGSCQSKQQASNETSSEKWSVKMANTMMAMNDTLLYLEKQLESDRKFRIRWQYDIAMLGQTIDKLGDIDPKYSAYLEDYVNYFVDDSGNVKHYKKKHYNIDRINPAKNLFTLYKRTGEEKYRLAIEKFVDQMKDHPKTSEGGFWHKQRYPHQMWLDGIYMASPFLAQYAKEFNAPEWFDVVADQINIVYKRTLDEKTGLLYHAFDESREQKWSDPETGHAPNFWSRAIGWYVMAIVDVLDFMPEEHAARPEIIANLNAVCDALLKVRDKDTGLWYQVLDKGGKEGNYIEGSGSAMYAYAFAKGAKKGYLDKSYMKIAESTFDSIINVLITEKEDGTLEMINICGGCGLGGNPYRDGSYEYYITEKRVKNDTKGVAPFIMTALELDR